MMDNGLYFAVIKNQLMSQFISTNYLYFLNEQKQLKNMKIGEKLIKN
jgi:hypothetical protein